MDESNWVIAKEEAGSRLDVFVTEQEEELTRSRVHKLLSEGYLTVNGKEVKAGYKLKSGDDVHLVLPEIKELNADPEPMRMTMLLS